MHKIAYFHQNAKITNEEVLSDSVNLKTELGHFKRFLTLTLFLDKTSTYISCLLYNHKILPSQCLL